MHKKPTNPKVILFHSLPCRHSDWVWKVRYIYVLSTFERAKVFGRVKGGNEGRKAGIRGKLENGKKPIKFTLNRWAIFSVCFY